MGTFKQYSFMITTFLDVTSYSLKHTTSILGVDSLKKKAGSSSEKLILVKISDITFLKKAIYE
jgi:hypothetical protein